MHKFIIFLSFTASAFCSYDGYRGGGSSYGYKNSNGANGYWEPSGGPPNGRYWNSDVTSGDYYNRHQPLQYEHKTNPSDFHNVLKLVQSVTDSVHRQSLRSGVPYEVKVEPSSDTKNVELVLQGHITDQLADSLPHDPNPTGNLRQGYDELSGSDTTLNMAGVDEINVPGEGPAIQLSVHGPLADKLKNMRLSELSLPGNMKKEILSGVYNQKLSSNYISHGFDELSGGEATLNTAGVDEINVPGHGPAIEMSLHGPLADKLKNTRLSELSLPGDMKKELLSCAYKKKQKKSSGCGSFK